MYAIVEIAGQQFKVEKDQKIYVHRLDAEVGSMVGFDRVLLLEDGGKVQVGMPTVTNVYVSASVVSHLKGDKVKIFKKKRRKGFQVLNGHRQALTELLIEGIGEGKPKVKAAAKTEPAAKVKPAEKPAVDVVDVKKPVAPKKSSADKTKATSKGKPVKAASLVKKTVKPAAKSSPKKETKPAAKAKPTAKKEDKKATKSAPKAKKNK